MIGKCFSHYRLLEKLGEGGMGVVWLAEDTRLGRKVALKFLPPEAARDVVRRQRFEQEARAAAALSHPGIATVHELAEAESQTFIVFEYVPGTTLRHVVARGGLEREELLDIAREIAAALAAAHSAGVVHRDLKPENVMRTPAGSCKVLDFGLARLSSEGVPDSNMETRSHLTSPGTIVGTVSYMAPEQLQGKESDYRCDIFSFGTLVYELAAGVHPFQASTSASTMANILTAEPPPLAQRNPLVPAELERIVRKCLRKRREERYQSTLDLSVDLANLKRDSGEGAVVASAAGQFTPEDETSLFLGLRRFIPTMRRVWELMVLLSLAALPAGIVLAWLVREASVIQTGLQNLWFTAVLLNTALLFFLRVSVLLRATVNPRTLPERVARFAPAIQISTLSYGVLALLAAPQLEVARYPVAAPLAIVFGLGAFLYGLVVEPMNNRATFPQAFAPETDEERARPKRDRRFLHIASAQAVLLVIYAQFLWFAATYAHPADAYMKSLAGEDWTAVVLYVIALLILPALLVSSAAFAVRSFKGDLQALRIFLRLFPFYWLLDQAWAVPVIWMGFQDPFHFGGPFVFRFGFVFVLGPPLAAVPFYQRRWARELLRESGEIEGERAKPKRDPRFGLIALTRAVIVLIIPVFCWVVSGGLSSNLRVAVERGEGLPVWFVWMVVATIIVAVCVFTFLGNAAIVASFLRGDLEPIPRMAASFPLFLLNLVAGPVVVAGRAAISMYYPAPTGWGDVMAQMLIFVSLFAHPCFVWLFLRERKLARELLRESGKLKQVEDRAQALHRPAMRTWWWYGNLFDCCIAFPLVGYLAWLGWQQANVAWGKAVYVAVVVGIGLNIASRITFLGLAFMEAPDFPKFLRHQGVWKQISMFIIALGLIALAVPLSEAHVGLAATLAALGIVGLAGTLIVEPVLDRGAFPETSSPPRS